ncbi:Protein of unknown function [Rathayibacter oskolensis]|uniref:DUF3027 domain-containing protein n=1 Tax=Rathayibacter oskolensis TaxID=1891671 RepID=A0A1X7N695_9MICO|nr:DUF3027 domain-containing protein [Rathayibacter oskolensis]SMH32031.1 Protein of unknown function [Rathayibacter oskolensis]
MPEVDETAGGSTPLETDGLMMTFSDRSVDVAAAPAEGDRADETPENDLPAEATPTAGTSADDGSATADGDAVADPVEPEPVYEVDPVLGGSVERARAALAEITPVETIGELVATLAQGEHVVSLQFANLVRGYPGWLWTATLSRIDETEDVNVLEVELLPGEGAVLAPDWVPWSVRLADYTSAQEAAESESDDEDEDDLVDDEFDETEVLDADVEDSDDDDEDDDDSEDDDSDDEDSDDEDSDDDDDPDDFDPSDEDERDR